MVPGSAQWQIMDRMPKVHIPSTPPPKTKLKMHIINIDIRSAVSELGMELAWSSTCLAYRKP